MMFVSGENTNKQLIESTSIIGSYGDQCISPPQKSDLEVSQLKSFSSYSGHSVWINNDGIAFAIGDNSRSQINDVSNGEYYEKPTQIVIDGFKPSGKEKFFSAVCGDNYTLYMTSLGRLIYVHEKGAGKPLFFNLKIPNPNSKNSKSNNKYISRKPLGLFGGSKRSAVIDEEGDFYIFTEELFNDDGKSKDQMPKHYSLPEAVTSIACCDNFLVVLTKSGKIYGNGHINEENDEFIEIQELSDFGPFTQVSGSYEHCIALNHEGKVYGYGSNYKGRLSLKSEIRTVDTFVLLDVFDDIKVYDISAGFYHSLFLMKGTDLAACGCNSYGELLASQPTKSHYFTPIKTKIKAETGVPYFIAGCNTSFAFVDCEAPPNRPNKRLEVERTFTSPVSTDSTSQSKLTASARKRIKSSSKPSIFNDKSSNNDSNDNGANSNNNNNNNDEEIKQLKEKVSELTEALQKSEEEKSIVIKKLLEITHIADQLHEANKDLAAKLLKAQLTLGLLAAVSNLSSNSDSSNSEEETEENSNKDESAKKEEIEKQREKELEKEREKQKEKEKEREREKQKQKEKEKEKERQKQREREKQKEKEKEKAKQKENEKEKQKEKENQKEKERQKQKEKEKESQKEKQKEDNEKKAQKSKQSESKPKSSDQESKQQQQQKDDSQKQQQKKKQPKPSDDEKSKQEEQQKKKQQKSSDEEKRKKEDQQKKKPQEPKTEDSSESSRHHRHHRHHHRSNQEQEEQQKMPKEPSNESSQSNEQHAPRRRHRDKQEKEQAESSQQKENQKSKTSKSSNKTENESKEQSQKMPQPPSILTQKENEQKKSIVRPTKPKTK